MKIVSIVAAVLLLAGPAVAQAPDGVHVMMPNGNSYYQSTAASGSLSGGGATCTWSTEDGLATVTFTGAYTTSWIHPYFDMYWFNTPATTPIALHVTSTGGGAYSFILPYNTGAWNYAAAETGLVGDWAFGHYIPPSDRFDCEIDLSTQSSAYDVTFVFEWGAGVDTEDATWSGVKALFQ